MKLLAIDTATERCSVALRVNNECIQRCVQTARGHADMILPMIQEVLADASLTIKQLDAIAFGRGPGAFTGVRIAVGVVQGLAFACDLPVIGISNLAAVAQQSTPVSGEILVCMDARMNEVYWSRFKFMEEGLVLPVSIEQVSAAEQVIEFARNTSYVPARAMGTGFAAYPALHEYFRHSDADVTALPHAREIALLGARDFTLGLAVTAAEAQPVYLRDQVTQVRSPV